MEIRPTKIGVAEVRLPKIRVLQIRVMEIYPAEVKAAEIHSAKDRPAKIRAAEIRAADVRLTQVGTVQVCPLQLGTFEAGASQHRVGQIQRRFARALMIQRAAAEHSQRGLDVGVRARIDRRSRRFCGHDRLVVDRGGRRF